MNDPENQLVEALRFYAAPHMYRVVKNAGFAPIETDNGLIARAALEEYAEEKDQDGIRPKGCEVGKIYRLEFIATLVHSGKGESVFECLCREGPMLAPYSGDTETTAEMRRITLRDGDPFVLIRED